MELIGPSPKVWHTGTGYVAERCERFTNGERCQNPAQFALSAYGTDSYCDEHFLAFYQMVIQLLSQVDLLHKVKYVRDMNEYYVDIRHTSRTVAWQVWHAWREESNSSARTTHDESLVRYECDSIVQGMGWTRGYRNCAKGSALYSPTALGNFCSMHKTMYENGIKWILESRDSWWGHALGRRITDNVVINGNHKRFT